MEHPGCGLRQADQQGRRGSERELLVEVDRGDPAVVVESRYAADGRCQSNPRV